MNITITGNLGAGKSTVCNLLKERGYEIISIGTIFRDIAKEKGITIEELNELAKTDRSFDDLVDNRVISLGKEKDGVVFDSRLAWHFIPNSFKVFLKLDVEVAARRIYGGNLRKAEKYISVKDTEEKLEERAKMELERYQKLYGVNYNDEKNYDLVIDTDNYTPEEVVEIIINKMKNREDD